jgi:hypothetical protein
VLALARRCARPRTWGETRSTRSNRRSGNCSSSIRVGARSTTRASSSRTVHAQWGESPPSVRTSGGPLASLSSVPGVRRERRRLREQLVNRIARRHVARGVGTERTLERGGDPSGRRLNHAHRDHRALGNIERLHRLAPPPYRAARARRARAPQGGASRGSRHRRGPPPPPACAGGPAFEPRRRHAEHRTLRHSGVTRRELSVFCP